MNNNLFMLMALINEHNQLSGYGLNKLIETRGYRSWADIGTTSIYVNLKKLSQLGYIVGMRSEVENSNGIASILYQCTETGVTELKRIIIHALKNAREHDRSFDLALSACYMLDKKVIIESLLTRSLMLENTKLRINSIRVNQANKVSFQGGLLFDRTAELIENEIKFTEKLIDKIEKEMI